uniref:Uncharacterized protein n=1 Tax=Candidatus Methanogaster sp. ANME-2c ERB4 TaxID=2759911 RepID=A0A7G9YGG6_9EURY|nr:hypothetical protein ONOHIMFI_00026 [Methanosarcinales archaeon ANME-2c ERB4]
MFEHVHTTTKSERFHWNFRLCPQRHTQISTRIPCINNSASAADRLIQKFLHLVHYICCIPLTVRDPVDRRSKRTQPGATRILMYQFDNPYDLRRLKRNLTSLEPCILYLIYRIPESPNASMSTSTTPESVSISIVCESSFTSDRGIGHSFLKMSTSLAWYVKVSNYTDLTNLTVPMLSCLRHVFQPTRRN